MSSDTEQETGEDDRHARWSGRILGVAFLGFAVWVTVRGLARTGLTAELLVPLLTFAGIPGLLGIVFLRFPSESSRLLGRAVSWILAYG